MMNVLQETPRVDQVESGALLDNGWMHPLMQYHYQEQDAAVCCSEVERFERRHTISGASQRASGTRRSAATNLRHRKNRDAVVASMQSASNGSLRLIRIARDATTVTGDNWGKTDCYRSQPAVCAAET
jgi:hypothetical protein